MGKVDGNNKHVWRIKFVQIDKRVQDLQIGKYVNSKCMTPI